MVGQRPINSESRNYFTFDLRDLTGHVAGATLKVYDKGDSLLRRGMSLRFFDVTTPPVKLNMPGGPCRERFFDLGHGKRFGTFDVRNLDTPGVRWFHLNHRAVRAINAARGRRFFSIGGQLLDVHGYAGVQYMFGDTGSTGMQRLTLEVT